MMKYNIALIPATQADKFIQYASGISYQLPADKYKVGNGSNPHVTLCHFEVEETEIDAIWEQTKLLQPSGLNLTFATRRNVVYPDHPALSDVCWVSLISDQLDVIKALHLNVAGIIKNPTNFSYDQYDPHMTLLNSRNKAQGEAINSSPTLSAPLSDTFVIALGTSDGCGQLTNILYRQQLGVRDGLETTATGLLRV